MATGRITKNDDSGAPATSPKRSEQPNATRNRNRHTNSWLASGKNDDGRVTEKSCGASPCCVSSRIGRASFHVKAQAIKGATRKNTTPNHTGSNHANADATLCATKASVTKMLACPSDRRDAARAETKMHQARPTASAHEDVTRSGALLRASATGRKKPMASSARPPLLSISTCKVAGLNVASKPRTMRAAAFAVTEISRA